MSDRAKRFEWDEEPDASSDTLRLELFRSLQSLNSTNAVDKLKAASDAVVRESRLVRFEAKKTKQCSQSQREMRAVDPRAAAVEEEVHPEEPTVPTTRYSMVFRKP